MVCQKGKVNYKTPIPYRRCLWTVPIARFLVYVKNCALGENAHGLIAKARSLWQLL